MNRFVVIFLTLIGFGVLQGCATTNYSYGHQFNTENISAISKGTTTTVELEKLIGSPFSKTVISETDEKWIYIYSSGTAKAQSYIVTMKVETTGQQKMLDVLIRNGIVINYTYTEGGLPYSYGTTSP